MRLEDYQPQVDEILRADEPKSIDGWRPELPPDDGRFGGQKDDGAPAPARRVAKKAPKDATKKPPDRKPSPYYVMPSGVVFRQENDEGEIDDMWICSELRVTALTRGSTQESWGRLLEFKDPEGHKHIWVMPIRLLAGDGLEFRQTLLDMGLTIAPGTKAKNHLASYVMGERPDAYVRCIEMVGWHGGAFVLQDETICKEGTESERVLYQGHVSGGTTVGGDLDGWRSTIGAWCRGNSRLMLAVSTAFAAPLLDICGAEGGGLHLRGASSLGKTAALKAASSVWGAPKEHVKTWRATGNGLEAVAAQTNDSLLCLDELGQVGAVEAGEIAYMLSNGAGKSRANRNGGARDAAKWRLLFLSSGELSLADHLRSGGKRSRAGQDVRLLDIPADTGKHGLFEELHGFAGGADLARAIGKASSEHFGLPARAFLQALVSSDREQLTKLIESTRRTFMAMALPADASGQADRAAHRFAIVAAGGELATAKGITGWEPGEALAAAHASFQAWCQARGGVGNAEDEAALSQVRHFLELHGESRFTDLARDSGHPTVNMAGYKRQVEEGTLYLAWPEVFRLDVCSGLNAKEVARVLIEKGILARDAAGSATSPHRVPGFKKLKRFYAIRGWEL